MARLPYRERGDLPPDARAVFDGLEGERGYVPNLYRAAANAPRLLPGFAAMVADMRADGALAPRLRELAALTVARLTGATIMWLSHVPLARNAGLTQSELLALPVWEGVRLFSETDRAVMAYAEEATMDVKVSDETWEDVAARLTHEELAELVMVVAFYNMVARVTEPLEVDVDPQYLDGLASQRD